MSDLNTSAQANAPITVVSIDRPPAPSADELSALFLPEGPGEIDVEETADADAGGEVDLSDLVAKVAGKDAKEALAEFEATKAKDEAEDEAEVEVEEAPDPAPVAAAHTEATPKPSAVEQAAERNRQRLLAAAAKEKAKRATVPPPVAPVVTEEPAKQTVSLEEFKQLSLRDPAAAIRLIGMEPEEFVGRAAAQSIGLEIEGEPAAAAASPEMKQLLEIIQGLQTEVKELKTETVAQREKREAEELAAKAQRESVAVFNSVSTELAEIKDSVPLLSAKPDAAAQVWEVISAYHQQWGHKKNFKFPTVAYVAKQLEAELQATSTPAAAPAPKSEPKPEEAKRPNRRRLTVDEIKDSELSLNPEERRKQMARLVARVT